jgi:hypothetical protein
MGLRQPVTFDVVQPCLLPPGQVVGMMLHQRAEDHVVGIQGEATCQLVDRLGGVFAQDDGVGLQVGSHEPAYQIVGQFISLGGYLALETCTPVHT